MASMTAYQMTTAYPESELENLSALATVVGALNRTACAPFPKTAKDELVAKVILGILYCCVFCISLCGNSLVIYVVVSNRNMQTVTNMFITNLAISDVVVSISSLWITPMYMYINRWIWGGPACYMFTLLQGGSIFISTFTLTAIAIDRYVAIVYPFKARLKIHVCLAVIISIWVAALLLVAPLVLNTRHTKSCGRHNCYEKWSMREMRRVYGIIVLILQYGIPFVIIIVCYSRLSLRLRTRSNSLATTRSVSRQEAELKRKQRLNKMLILMVVIFGLCWLPINALNLIRDAMKEIAFTNYFPLLFLLGHLLGMSATCWNPILYSWMNDNFRREFQAVLPCFPRVGRVNHLSYRGTVMKRTKKRKAKLKSNLSTQSVQLQLINNNTLVTDASLQNCKARRHTITDGNAANLCPMHSSTEQRIKIGDGPSVLVLEGKASHV